MLFTRYSAIIIPAVASQCTVRKEIRNMSKEEVKTFVEAVKKLKEIMVSELMRFN